ncbi:MAG: AAA family ATPase [Fibrobacteres bacterium]|nr:AAA family ATPase [Fibrobacterota bacterium]
MIRTITIRGFKSIPDLKLELGRVNCFIGANGVGKSNILEAIGVLGAAANGVVDDEALLRRGVRPGLPRLYKTSFETIKTPAHVGLNADNDLGATYRVSLLNPLEKPEPAWSFKTERLTDGDSEIVSEGVRNKKNLNPTSGLAALKMVDVEPGSAAGLLMKCLQDYAIYSPNTPTLRSMVPDPQTRSPVGLSGGQLAEGYQEFAKEFLGKDEDLLDQILDLVDWVSDVGTTSQSSNLLSPSIARTKQTLRFTDRFMQKSRNELSAYDASEGALYVLFCALLCLSPKTPRFFAIDNLDQALNPRLVTRLTSQLMPWLERSDAFLGSGAKRQILFTSHNPAVLDGLDLTNPEIRLFAVDRNSEGHTSVKRLEMTPELTARRGEYPLSRLWMMGHLGAVPNV